MFMYVGTAAGVAAKQVVERTAASVQDVNVTEVQRILTGTFNQIVHVPHQPPPPPSYEPVLHRVWSGVCSVQRPVHPPGGGSVQVDDVWKLHALLMRDMAARDCSPAGSQHAHLRGRRAERGAAAHGLGGRHRQSSSPNAETSRWIDSKRNRPGVMRGPTKASSVQLYSNGAALFSSPCRCSALVACSPTVRPLKSDPPDFSKSYTWFFGVPNPTP